MMESDQSGSGSTYASVTRSNLPSASSTHTAQQTQPATLDPTAAADPADLVAASLERSRANLERFQRQQAAAAAMDQGPARAARRRRQADVPDLFGAAAGGEASDLDDPRDDFPLHEEGPSVEELERRRRERTARQREEEEMARAIAASLAESEQRDASGEGGAPPQTTTRPEPMDEDEELDVDDDVEGGFDFHHEARLYDDEDAQLQAAINASLQEQALPEDWKLPVEETAPVRSAERAVTVDKPAELVEPPEAEKTEDAVEEEEPEPEVHELSAEELRRKRLERFM
jgi:hypothetical protein